MLIGYIKYCYHGDYMELYPLQVFLTIATEKSFSRAAEKPCVGRLVSKCSVSANEAESASRDRERQLGVEMRL